MYKNIIPVIPGILILLMILSCENQQPDLKGKWSYQSSTGEAVELWADGKSIATISEIGQFVNVYRYVMKHDSVHIFNNSGNNQPLTGFLISEYHENQFTLTRDTVKDILKRIDPIVPEVSEDIEFRESMEKEFRQRIKTKEKE